MWPMGRLGSQGQTAKGKSANFEFIPRFLAVTEVNDRVFLVDQRLTSV